VLWAETLLMGLVIRGEMGRDYLTEGLRKLWRAFNTSSLVFHWGWILLMSSIEFCLNSGLLIIDSNWMVLITEFFHPIILFKIIYHHTHLRWCFMNCLYICLYSTILGKIKRLLHYFRWLILCLIRILNYGLIKNIPCNLNELILPKCSLHHPLFRLFFDSRWGW